MFTCIQCSKEVNNGSFHQQRQKERQQQEDDDTVATPRTKQAIKILTMQIKDMALKASGAYRNCKSCSGSNHNHKGNCVRSDTAMDSAKFNCAYHRTGSASSTPKLWGKEMETQLKGLSSGEGTPTSVSGRTESLALMEEDEPKEWVAQVEPGVLITFDSLPQGGNELKRIRFSREIFNKWQAQRWWTENYDKVMELYNVQHFDQQASPLPMQATSDEVSKNEAAKGSPATPPLSKECPPHNIQLSKSVDQRSMQLSNYYDSAGLASTPKLSTSFSGTKTETSSLDGSVSSREVDHSGELSMSNASDMETEWVEQDQPGVYITLRAISDGTRELRRVRFSRERFGEMQARHWWEENRARIQEQYL